MQILKVTILKIFRAFGLFRLARLLTRSRLRILCYHGISLADEHNFRPGVYMRPATFRRRMEMIKARRYPVLKLSDALSQLKSGDLPDYATVITIDDGWAGMMSVAAPILQKFDFPSTLYVTTYYLRNRTQVFNMALAYVLMKGAHTALDVGELEAGLSGIFDLATESERDECLDVLLMYGETLDGALARQALLEKVADKLGVAEELGLPGLFRIIGPEDAASLPATGMNIQLHTHRHRFPAKNKQEAEREITENRRELSMEISGPLEHFCYPSGQYASEQVEWLEEWGIKSATTCDVGLNPSDSNPYLLKRILDSDELSDIEIEAELCGLMELKRIAMGVLRPTR